MKRLNEYLGGGSFGDLFRGDLGWVFRKSWMRSVLLPGSLCHNFWNERSPEAVDWLLTFFIVFAIGRKGFLSFPFHIYICFVGFMDPSIITRASLDSFVALSVAFLGQRIKPEELRLSQDESLFQQLLLFYHLSSPPPPPPFSCLAFWAFQLFFFITQYLSFLSMLTSVSAVNNCFT